MSKIKQLDDVLASKIAAGEVIERPMNVVKELVENSIDASSTKIDILIEDGGLQSIWVIDNGEGMDKKDAELCFYPHATSKIKKDEDLFCIQTLGFRGEAMPSIASICHMTLKTSRGSEGTMVEYHYGTCSQVSTCFQQTGTSIKVERLFQNVPARLKYMKSSNVEFSHIQAYIEKIALSYPCISFSLVHNNKAIYQSNGSGNILEVISSQYGLSIAKNMIAVDFKDEEFHISGYLSKIDITRASKKDIITLVNHRVVKNQVTIDAIVQTYKSYLFDKRYPLAFINIDIDPYLVDVNVHPAKMEVRFSKENKLKELLLEGFQKALQQKDLTYEIKEEIKKPTFQFKDIQQSFDFEYLTTPSVTIEPVDSIPSETCNRQEEIKKPTEIKEFVKEEVVERKLKQKLFAQGQVHGTYIVAQDEDALYLVDQHAAKERVNYEYFCDMYQKQDTRKQDLLVPIVLEYPSSQIAVIEEKKHYLYDVGIYLEMFGTTSFIVKQLPVWMKNVDELLFIESMIEQVIKHNKVDLLELQKDAIAMLSCKASLKGNSHLSLMAMQQLLDDLMCCDNPYVCPHGRPTLIRYSAYELEKLFKRVV
ncbi:DNA mismatch repair endonuclease MutL [Tannockella kyphosi]|uniref:DNA mismatch repair endonuclease MutL n=1 Tax=Tannockella kyphosi TaxID=2899121 RepID=UPI002012164A|nr:DNA mismatch repair endonuclease MutL [Tannockella kyphosi]